jgi:hypothetical protein
MNIKDLSNPNRSKVLNESAAKQFGYKLNIDSFTTDQLREARDIMVGKLSKFELSSDFSAVFEDKTYQKNRAFLEILTQAISERAMAPNEKAKQEKYVKGMKKVKGEFNKRYGKNGENVMYATATKMAQKESVGEAMQVLRSALTEQVISEGAEENAALIMSSRDMVDRVTGWLDDVASLKAERLLELIDSIRDELGSEVSGQFADKVKPSLDEIYACLEKNRQLLAQAVSILTGEEAPTMGAEGAPEPAPGEDLGDQFGAAAPAVGGEVPEGRMKRESINYSRKKKV